MKNRQPLLITIGLFVIVAASIASCSLLSGCAYMRSTTTRATDPKTGIVSETTTATGYALFDANAVIGKFSNRSGYTTNGTFGPGTYATGFEASATSTNLNEIIGAVVGAAIKAAIKP